MFFEDLKRFGTLTALVDSETGEEISYAVLDDAVEARMADFGGLRQLVFIAAKNNFGTVVDYLAALRGGHVVHMLESLEGEKARSLIALYHPNLIIGDDRAVTRYSDVPHALYPRLALLMATSGSTGEPKFVKLSRDNIQSNAESIAEYLELTATERAFGHLKLYYSYGLSVLHSHLQVGATLVLTSRNVTEFAFWNRFRHHRATSFAGVPYTFETLLHAGFNPAEYPDLRYATQAGGKLEEGMVKTFVSRFNASGKNFYVMYGQTEAAPRISYLPPVMAEAHPGTIGRVVPGGRLYLVDEEKREIFAPDTPGELVYEGPNVMLGYATAPKHLASDETPPCLLTGDIACRTAEGLFYIVGRNSRFVKLFGIRVSLDHIQSDVKARYPVSAVTGDDTGVVIALETEEARAGPGVIGLLAARYGLPDNMFHVTICAELPLLSSGKPDYKAILATARAGVAEKPPSLFRRLVRRVMEILELDDKTYPSILEIYAEVLPVTTLTLEDSFQSLNADSLSFVALSIALEQALGEQMPENWQSLPISALENIYARQIMDESVMFV